MMKPLEQRFWNKVEKGQRCWKWLGAKKKNGYGNFGTPQGTWIAHRMAFLLSAGSINVNLYVLHSCDNPSCVNPKHLFQGTQKQNLEDAKEKSRIAIGKKNGYYVHPEAFKRDINGKYRKL